jgi:glycosyltransferase involved in cell wall biosynthesis
VFFPWRLRSLIREISPDVLVTYNWGAIDAVIGATFGRLCPIIHTDDGFSADEAAGPKWRRVLTRRFVLSRVHSTVVPSRTLERVALSLYRLPRSRVFWIPNGIDINRFQPRRDLAWRRLYQIPDDAFVLGTVAVLRPEKNLGHLLTAFSAARLDRSWLVIVGDGPCRTKLEELARRLGVGGNVIFTGSVPDPVPCYAALDMFVMSSVTEQMPVALLEAMACGLPALCTDVGDTREILGEESDVPVVVPAGDVAAFRDALSALASRASRRKELGVRNRNRCLREYSFDRMVDRYAERYHDAAKRPS